MFVLLVFGKVVSLNYFLNVYQNEKSHSPTLTRRGFASNSEVRTSEILERLNERN
jgi:hypothetical protein